MLVNFNYRVGALGFLAAEQVRQDGDLNVGLLDQRKLLEWVQKHIKQVVNPSRVCILIILILMYSFSSGVIRAMSFFMAHPPGADQ